MAHRKPNHADAELMLKLYDLRRESVMRASRKTLLHWIPKSVDDLLQIAKLDHPDNAAWRQVASYFEMAYGLAKNGIVPPDFVAENNGEGLVLYAKIEPFLEAYRTATTPHAFANAEWLVRHSKYARERLALHHKRLATLRDVPLPPPAQKETQEQIQTQVRPQTQKTTPNNPPKHTQPSSTS
ncbi:MAG: hypothetical protein R3F33_11450 [Planctomycetota bacterium]